MSVLSNLKLVASKKSKGLPPLIQRRNKLIRNIFDQIQLAQAQKEGRTYAPQIIKTVVNKLTGERKTIEAPKRMREWWFTSESGKLNLAIKYGTRQLELGKGKNAVELTSRDELLPVLQKLKEAVELGELDAQLEVTSGALRAVFKR